MSTLFTLLLAHACSSTHHRIALDALPLLRGADAPAWRTVFLAHHHAFLQGAKAPDTTFKDFRNHVLHIADNGWGGAPAAAAAWYERTVEAFAARDWRRGAYAAGVLSHYVADPHQPLHTGQTEHEGAIHRAFEWSVAKSYGRCRSRIEGSLGGYPDIEPPHGADWVEAMVREGARAAHPYYDVIVDRFDVHAAARRPQDGLDDVLVDAVAQLLARATASYARILDRALAEADVAPPRLNLDVRALLVGLSVPVRWVIGRIEDVGERLRVQAMVDELRREGKAVRTLPEDDREVRRMHAMEVLQVPLRVLDAAPAKAVGMRHGAPAEAEPGAAQQDKPPARRARPTRLRFHLELESPIVDAPSIGPKTAARLEAIGVRTVRDFLAFDPDVAAPALDARHITARTLREWRDQTGLVLRVPNLRGHDAQILTACGVADAADLARLDPDGLYAIVEPFARTAQGMRILRGAGAPPRDEVADWIAWAQHARALAA